MKKTLIGLYSPLPQSGKSTAVRVLSQHADLDVLKISGAIKAMCAAILVDFGISKDLDAWVDGSQKDAKIEGLTPKFAKTSVAVDALYHYHNMFDIGRNELFPIPRENGEMMTRQELLDDSAGIFYQELYKLPREKGITSRDIQKIIGLQWGRQCYGYTFWTRGLQSQIDNSTKSVIVVDDVRFPDDYALIKNQSGIMVRINKPSARIIDAHPSEGLLESYQFDANLENDSTLESYETKIAENLTKFLP